MHQEQRIGLALGVLLVGACAAFFFRNEARPVSHLPRLQHAEQLDDRIAERSMRPYLKGVDAVEAADRRRSGPSSGGISGNSGAFANDNDPFDSSSVKLVRDNSSREKKAQVSLLENDNEIQELEPIAIPTDRHASADPAHNDDSAANNVESVSRRAVTKSAAVSATGRSHVVQRGETLSSIAAKTLGSQNRFREIFEANQDQLNDPDDLKLGMTLRIPDSTQASAPKAATHSPHSAISQEPTPVELPTLREETNLDVPQPVENRSLEPKSESRDGRSIMLPPELPADAPIELPESPTPDEPVPAKKFVPARRVLPPQRPAGPQARSTPARELSGRRLTQASLESTSGKIAR